MHEGTCEGPGFGCKLYRHKLLKIRGLSDLFIFKEIRYTKFDGFDLELNLIPFSNMSCDILLSGNGINATAVYLEVTTDNGYIRIEVSHGELF